ncbi:hypothetical protein COO60DRAFT_1516847 [Scenedesmus sp. NREL 46B-D3]|nr:hypothetical protein COO60DRAFT_1516847 [Scenedesmus sp. NREL 46B-D3]
MRSCRLGLQHLGAIGWLTGLLQLDLPGNSFVAEQQQQDPAVAPAMQAADTPAAGNPATALTAEGFGAAVDALAAVSDGCSSRNSHVDRAGTCNSTGSCSYAMHQQQQPPQEQPEVSSSARARQGQHWKQQCGKQAAQQLPGDWEVPLLSSWLVNLQQLQVLDLSDCRLQQGLLDQLPELTALTRLQLRSACLDVADPVSASAAVSARRLQRLVVGEEDEQQQKARYSQHVLALGAEAAASCAIIGRMQLVHLDLRSIDISYTGCTEQQLQQLMVCCPNLRLLNASGNVDLGSAGGCCI